MNGVIGNGTGTGAEGGVESDGSEGLESEEEDQAEKDRQKGELDRMEKDSQAVGVSQNYSSNRNWAE